MKGWSVYETSAVAVLSALFSKASPSGRARHSTGFCDLGSPDCPHGSRIEPREIADASAGSHRQRHRLASPKHRKQDVFPRLGRSPCPPLEQPKSQVPGRLRFTGSTHGHQAPNTEQHWYLPPGGDSGHLKQQPKSQIPGLIRSHREGAATAKYDWYLSSKLGRTALRHGGRDANSSSVWRSPNRRRAVKSPDPPW